MTIKNIHHTINNIEFNVENIEQMRSFYGEVFGWTFTEFGEEYLEFNDGNMVGGFTKGPKKDKEGPLIIIYSENLEKTEQLVKQHGGTISTPTFSFPGGHRFHFKDIEGNELAVWSE